MTSALDTEGDVVTNLDLDDVDRELRLLATVRAAIRRTRRQVTRNISLQAATWS